MTWLIVVTAVIAFAGGAAIATWWHRITPTQHMQILRALCGDLRGDRR